MVCLACDGFLTPAILLIFRPSRPRIFSWLGTYFARNEISVFGFLCSFFWRWWKGVFTGIFQEKRVQVVVV